MRVLVLTAFTWATLPALAPVPAEQAPPADDCVTIRSEARYRALGYDHVAILHSACPSAVSCEVWTDVDPQRHSTRLRPGEVQEIVTRIGSPASSFEAYGQCEASETKAH
jgi:hypothetical protein